MYFSAADINILGLGIKTRENGIDLCNQNNNKTNNRKENNGREQEHYGGDQGPIPNQKGCSQGGPEEPRIQEQQGTLGETIKNTAIDGYEATKDALGNAAQYVSETINEWTGDDSKK